MNWTIRLLTLAAIVALSACATPLREEQRSAIKMVGIVNDFPEHANFIVIGTTIFSNKKGDIEAPGLKDEITERVAAILRERGYNPEGVPSGQPTDKYDIVLRLLPRDVYNTPLLFGYGFYQRFLLGNSMMRQSYVALNLIPMIKGRSTCMACYEFAHSDLPFDTMPEHWTDLSEADQKIYLDSLRKDVDAAMIKLLDEAGL